MNNLSGISYTSNVASLDGLSIVQADAIYVDGSDIDPGSYVKKSGDTMSGTLNMGTNPVKSSHAPTVATDLTNKAYVDATVAGSGYVPYTGATSTVNLNTQAISAGAATFSGTITNSGIASGTPSFTVGINGSNQLIKYANPTSSFTGSVSAGALPYASSANVLADSLVSQASGTVTNTGNQTVAGTVDLTGGAITTTLTSTGWGVPYFTTTGGNNILNYTYSSGQGVITSTASATSMAVFATGVTISGSYQMIITGFKTSASSYAVSINIRQGSTYAGSTIIQTVSVSGPTVAQTLSFNFSTNPAYGVNLIFEVIAYAGVGSSSLAYFNTITLYQLTTQLLSTNVVGKLNASKGVEVTGGLTNNGTLTNTGSASASEYILNSLTTGSSGLEAELTNIINFGLNFRGSNVVTGNLGGALRIDGRSGQPLFTWFYRPASGTEGGIMTLDSSGNLNTGGKLSVADSTSVLNDFYIKANSGAWNTTYTKGLYMRYSTNGTQDSAYIQSIDRSTVTGKPLGFYASQYNFDSGKVGIGFTSAPDWELTVKGVFELIDVSTTQKYAIYSDSNNLQINPRTSTGGYSRDGIKMNPSGDVTIPNFLNVGVNVGSGLSLTANYGMLVSAQQFFVAGATNTFFPCFVDTGAAWNQANRAVFEIGRSSVHQDAYGQGAFQYRCESHSTQWGNGSEYINHEYACSVGWAYGQWIANVAQDFTSTYVVVWLRGGFTYQFSSTNGCTLVFVPKSSTTYPVYTGVGNNSSYTYTTTVSAPFTSTNFNSKSLANNIFNAIQPTFIVDCYSKWLRFSQVAWGGGYWIYNAFYRNSTNSKVLIHGCVSGYTGTAQLTTLGIGIQTASGSYFQQLQGGASYFINNTYNHMPYPFTCEYSLPFSTDGSYSGGYYHIYLWNAYGIITDSNDYVNVAITVSPNYP